MHAYGAYPTSCKKGFPCFRGADEKKKGDPAEENNKEKLSLIQQRPAVSTALSVGCMFETTK